MRTPTTARAAQKVSKLTKSVLAIATSIFAIADASHARSMITLARQSGRCTK
jgi:hypothetical protein